jgi:hypothetical protein
MIVYASGICRGRRLDGMLARYDGVPRTAYCMRRHEHGWEYTCRGVQHAVSVARALRTPVRATSTRSGSRPLTPTLNEYNCHHAIVITLMNKNQAHNKHYNHSARTVHEEDEDENNETIMIADDCSHERRDIQVTAAMDGRHTW